MTCGEAARVVVLSRVGCHLCDEARVIVQRLCAELGVTWHERDVDDDPELTARYSDHVPVTLVDGQPVDYWFVDEDRLRAALTA